MGPPPRPVCRVAALSEVDLSDLLPRLPLEELLRREALGAPGQPAVEVGLSRERFAEPRGRALSAGRLALLRALGAVHYPAGRDRIVAEVETRVGRGSEVADAIVRLPDGEYGGEYEVLQRLAAAHSALGGNQEGNGAQR